MRQPGTMERTFGQSYGGPGLGGMFLATLAGAFVGTAVAGAFFDNDPGSDAAAGDAQGAEGDVADTGADYGDSGGDFGGGDFGGGDFGGGDFGGF
jgi:hypothetical protein